MAEEVLAFIAEAGAKSVRHDGPDYRTIVTPMKKSIDYEGRHLSGLPVLGRDGTAWTGERLH